MIGVIGLILAIAVLIVCCYRGWGALPSSLIAALVILITNGMPIWESFSQYFMGGYAGAYASYFLMLSSSAALIPDGATSWSLIWTR